MTTIDQVMLAGFAAGLIGFIGPVVTRRLPEPQSAVGSGESEKVPYRQVGDIRFAALIQGALSAVAAAVLAWRVERPELLGIWVLLAGVGSWLAFIDWHTRYLPYRITAPLYVAVWCVVVVVALFEPDTDLLVTAAVSNLATYAVFRLIYFVGQRTRGGFGFGDVRLAAIIAVALAPLGYSAVVGGLYAGFLLGAVGSVGLRLLRVTSGSTFAFGPYLLLGAAVGGAWLGQ